MQYAIPETLTSHPVPPPETLTSLTESSQVSRPLRRCTSKIQPTLSESPQVRRISAGVRATLAAVIENHRMCTALPAGVPAQTSQPPESQGIRTITTVHLRKHHDKQYAPGLTYASIFSHTPFAGVPAKFGQLTE